MAVYESALDLIGNTPMVDVSSLSPNPHVRIVAKLEGQNPSGSVKDRIALAMVEEAEKDGRLRPGKTLLEPSSGNTGIGLALVCNVKGYRLRVVMPTNVSVERRQVLEVWGAQIIESPGEQGSNGAVRLAQQLAAADPDLVFLYQYANPANPRAHYEGTGPEIWHDCPEVTDFVAGLGTSGTLMGVGRFLKEQNPKVSLWAIEPPAGEMVDGLRNLEDGYIPPIFESEGGAELLDFRTIVGPRESIEWTRKLRDIGIFAGISSGAAMAGAARCAVAHRGGCRGRGAGRRRLEVPLLRGVDRRHRRSGRAGQAHHLFLSSTSSVEPARLEYDLFELQERARAVLERSVFDYVAGGADDEATLRDNVAAWSRWRLRPTVLEDVSQVNTDTTVLGQPVSAPVLLAPVAYQRLVHPEGEVALARAAAAADSLMVLSTRSSVAIEEVAAAAPGHPLWFQVYLLTDRDWTAQLVDRAVAAGARALVLTVDTPVLGYRRRDVRNRFELPEGIGMANLPAGVDFAAANDGHYLAAYQSPALIPSDLTWLAERSGLPVVAKGVLSGPAARRCVDAGAQAVVVSNHGGRQLDGTVATADALAEVVDAVGDQAEVYVDGGIRRGSDVLRALALGARAVLIGRPAVWALAVGGADGVVEVLSHLMAELGLAMALAGAPTVAAVNRGMVVAGAGPRSLEFVDDRPIGMFDSGFGGLTRGPGADRPRPRGGLRLRRATPAATPTDPARSTRCGSSPRRSAAGWSTSDDVKLVVVACNTASAAALDAAAASAAGPGGRGHRPRGAGGAARATRNRRVGVIGTVGTIRSGAYQRAIGDLPVPRRARLRRLPGLRRVRRTGRDALGPGGVLAERLLAPVRDAGSTPCCSGARTTRSWPAPSPTSWAATWCSCPRPTRRPSRCGPSWPRRRLGRRTAGPGVGPLRSRRATWSGFAVVGEPALREELGEVERLLVGPAPELLTLTVLGCDGSHAGAGGAASGYLVRSWSRGRRCGSTPAGDLRQPAALHRPGRARRHRAHPRAPRPLQRPGGLMTAAIGYARLSPRPRSGLAAPGSARPSDRGRRGDPRLARGGRR